MALARIRNLVDARGREAVRLHSACTVPDQALVATRMV